LNYARPLRFFSMSGATREARGPVIVTLSRSRS